jgi:hypothetical protein
MAIFRLRVKNVKSEKIFFEIASLFYRIFIFLSFNIKVIEAGFWGLRDFYKTGGICS